MFRYVVISNPLSNKNQWIITRCNLILILGWLIGSVLASITIGNTSTFPFSWENQTFYDCRVELNEEWSKIYTTFSFIITFAIPLIIQLFAYVSIGNKLIQEKTSNDKSHLRKSVQQSDTTKVITFLI